MSGAGPAEAGASATAGGGDGPVLLCFDGSDDSAHAIATAGRVLAPQPAIVLSVWVPIAVWEPYDPATVLSAPFERLAADALGLDELGEEVARQKVDHGVEIARAAGFQTEGRVGSGKPRRAICDVAEEIDAAVIVLGSRGLGRVGGALLGSVSSAVAVRARRPVLIVPPPSADDH